MLRGIRPSSERARSSEDTLLPVMETETDIPAPSGHPFTGRGQKARGMPSSGCLGWGGCGERVALQLR